MRHIPTSLYIDTEVFIREKLCFEKKGFSLLKNTFIKGELRLLVPAMMERELIRHYRRQTEECADAVNRVQKKYPMPFLNMWKTRPNEEIIDKCINELKSHWVQFKLHFKVEDLPLVVDLDRVVDWYFKIRPPFSTKKLKEFPDAFILSALESYYKDQQCEHCRGEQGWRLY